MEKINLDVFMKYMEKDGIWVLAMASLPMQLHTQKYNMENYEKEILKYMTPQKYIKKGDKIIVVSLTEQIWGGVRVFNKEDITFKEMEGIICSIQNKRKAKKLVSATDFLEVVGEKTFEGKGLIIKTDQYKTTEEFKEAMLATGYLTNEEYDYYSDSKNYKNLTVIDVINQPTI